MVENILLLLKKYDTFWLLYFLIFLFMAEQENTNDQQGEETQATPQAETEQPQGEETAQAPEAQDEAQEEEPAEEEAKAEPNPDPLIEEVLQCREDIEACDQRVQALLSREDFAPESDDESQRNAEEMVINVDLAFRHLEDAQSRLERVKDAKKGL